MKDFNGRVAAITGAGSGIGRALANALARRGAHLALSDIDDAGLAETVAQCEGFGVKITSQRLDVADRDAVYAWADHVVAEHGRVNLIVNNAGVALGATVESMSYEDFEWLMNINFWGVVYGTKAFLPHLKASGEGHIVNLSSVFGLISVPVAVRLQRRQVRGTGIHRLAAHGARDRRRQRLGDDHPPRRHQDEHCAQRPHGRERRATWPVTPRRQSGTSSAPSSPARRRRRTRSSPRCDATGGAPSSARTPRRSISSRACPPPSTNRS